METANFLAIEKELGAEIIRIGLVGVFNSVIYNFGSSPGLLILE